jgi:hypothetical protein
LAGLGGNRPPHTKATSGPTADRHLPRLFFGGPIHDQR